MENDDIKKTAETSEPTGSNEKPELNVLIEPKKDHNKLFLIFVIIIIAAGGFWFWKSEQAKKEAASKRTAIPPVVVKVMTVKRMDVPVTLDYTGQTNGYKQAEVRAQVGGILMKKEYTEGQQVKAGQVLFRIDPSPYRAALNKNIGNLKQSEVQMNLAKIEFNRVSTLYKSKAVSKADFDNAEASFNASKAAVDAARAAVRQSQIDLNWTVVRAPISGLSSKEERSVGNLVTTDSNGSLLTTIVQADPVYVDFAVPADEHRINEWLKAAGVVKVATEGLTVRVALGDGTFYDKKGKIDFRDQFVDSATATIKARAIFDNPGNLLYPGQFVRVFVDGNIVQNVINIPLRSTLQTSKGPIVYVLDKNNVPALRPVKIVYKVDNSCMIGEGLTAGERIIIDGVAKVMPGKAVKVAEDENTASADKQALPASNKAAASSDAQQN